MEPNIHFDADKLITLIEEREALWNTAVTDYNNKIIKNERWAEISREFVAGYDDLPELEKENIARVLQKRWKSLRTSFTRELARRQAVKAGTCKNRKQYVYYEKMCFLLPVASNRISQTIPANLDDEDDGDDVEGERDTELELEQPDEEATAVPPVPNSCPSPRQTTSTLPHPKKKIKTDVVDQMYETLQKTLAMRSAQQILEQDEDRLFLLSLVKEIKSIPSDKRLLAKSEILQVIHRYQMKYPTGYESSATYSNPTGYQFISTNRPTTTTSQISTSLESAIDIVENPLKTEYD